MNNPIVHRKWKKERGDKFCFVSSVLQKNVPILALAGPTKVAEYDEAQVCKLESHQDCSFKFSIKLKYLF